MIHRIAEGKRMGGRLVLTFAAALTLCFGAPAVSHAATDSPKVAWDLSLWGKSRALTANVEKMSEIVGKETGGRFAIKLHYGGALSPPKENIDGVKLGAFQAGLVCPHYAPGKLPASMALFLPFLPISSLNAQKTVDRAFFDHPALVEEYGRWNVRLVMPTLLAQYETMGTGNPPRTLADWKGVRVRAGGGIGGALKTLGASPTSMPAPEVYAALERGLLTAVAFPTYASGAYRLHEISNWYTTDLNLGRGDCPFIVNKEAWNALPAAYRKIMEDAIPAALDHQEVAYHDADKKYLPKFAEKGLVRIEFSPEERAELVRQGGEPVWNAWVADAEKNGIPGRELLDLILKAAAGAS